MAATSRNEFSARKDERNGLLSVLWFNIAHYALRPWPWILTALAAIVLYPHLEHPETGYMLIVSDHVPRGSARHRDRRIHGGFHVHHRHATELGRLLSGVGFLSPLHQARCDRQALRHMSRLATVLLVIASAASFLRFLRIIRSGWQVVLEVGAGTGGVYLLRWYWWRINAWSEISAMATALVMTDFPALGAAFRGIESGGLCQDCSHYALVTTLGMAHRHLCHASEPQEVLLKFYRDVRPHVTGWKPIARLAPEIPQPAIWDEICFPGSWAAPWFTWHCSALDTCSCSYAKGDCVPGFLGNLRGSALLQYRPWRLGRRPTCSV